MTRHRDNVSLKGKKGLIVGIANTNSIAYGCAKVFQDAGADLAVTYLDAKAEQFVRALAEHLSSSIIVPCDFEPRQLEAVFTRVGNEWRHLDFLLHSIAYAPKEDMHRRITDCSQTGFAMALDVSCHSFIRMARLAEPLTTNGGCLLTVTFYGAEKVVEEYNLMGQVKAALESCVRYMAAELGSKRISVNALSSGPLKTRAANLATFLVGDGAAALTGNIEYVDAGFHTRRLMGEFEVVEWNASKSERSTRSSR